MSAATQLAQREMTLSEFYRRVYQRERLPRPDQRGTREQYEIQLRHLDRYAQRQRAVGELPGGDGPLLLTELSDALVKGCMTDRLLSGRAVETVNKVHTHVGAVWNFAYEERYVDVRMRCKKFKPHKRLPQCWSMAEMGELLKATEKARGLVGAVRAATFLPALLWTIYATAARVSAVLLTPVENFDPQAGTLLVPADAQKQRTDQLFTLKPRTVHWLMQLGSRQRGLRLLFGDWDDNPDPQRETEAPWELLRQATIDAGLVDSVPWQDAERTKRDWRKHLFHKIRRTVATHSLHKSNLNDVQQLLGHANQQTTLSYIDPRHAPQRNVTQAIPEVPGFADEGAPAQLRLYRGGEEAG